MGLQIVIDASDLDDAVRVLEAGGVACELFSMSREKVGISIPTNVLDSVGEPEMAKILSSFTYIDLWSGEMRERRRE
jgi:hypothetical protein